VVEISLLQTFNLKQKHGTYVSSREANYFNLRLRAEEVDLKDGDKS